MVQPEATSDQVLQALQALRNDGSGWYCNWSGCRRDREKFTYLKPALSHTMGHLGLSLPLKYSLWYCKYCNVRGDLKVKKIQQHCEHRHKHWLCDSWCGRCPSSFNQSFRERHRNECPFETQSPLPRTWKPGRFEFEWDQGWATYAELFVVEPSAAAVQFVAHDWQEWRAEQTRQAQEAWQACQARQAWLAQQAGQAQQAGHAQQARQAQQLHQARQLQQAHQAQLAALTANIAKLSAKTATLQRLIDNGDENGLHASRHRFEQERDKKTRELDELQRNLRHLENPSSSSVSSLSKASHLLSPRQRAFYF